MQSTVAAMILAFVYRCGGSDGFANLSGRAPSSRFIPITGPLLGHLQTDGASLDPHSQRR
jgi:hypothetical protein